ncbi:hypothetical protein FACS1894141_5310 [Spirochaetia bacterium]|nr:hypothetical protein FACS1894141_5310 [Spirochaetia bacterium]
MKRFLMVLAVLTGTALCFAQTPQPLDKGLAEAAVFLSTHIPIGTSVTVYNFTTGSEDLSKYMVTELSSHMARNGMTVLDRNNLDATQNEIEFGWTSAVNQNSAQRYGEALGADIVVLGTFTASGNNSYRLQIQAIATETKILQASPPSITIKQDAHLLALLHVTVENEYRFTTEEKASAGFQNMTFGLGSFRMGDPLGGATVLGAEVVSLGLIITGAVFLVGADQAAMNAQNDYMNTHVGGGYYDSYGGWVSNSGYSEWMQSYDDKYDEEIKKGAVFMGIGGGVFLLSVTWGFVRPYLYDKPVAVQKVAKVIDRVHIDILPRADDALAVRVSYQLSF